MSLISKQEKKDILVDCIFCLIVAKETTADIVFETDETLFFRDISPKAPVHVLGIPKRHISAVAALEESDDALVGQLLRETAELATRLNVSNEGFRLIINNGSNAGQAVEHMHVHILGGEPLGPMRCTHKM